MKIGFATHDWSITPLEDGTKHIQLGGSGWYRIGSPYERLRALGHEVHAGKLMFDRETNVLNIVPWGRPEVSGDELDIIFIQRYMDEGIAECIKRWGNDRNCMIVNDIDDWWYGIPPANTAFATTHKKNNPLQNTNHYRKLLGVSDLIVTSTPFLQEKMGRLNRDVRLCRNTLMEPHWPWGREHQGKPRVGWVGALPWRSGDVEQLAGILGPLADAEDLEVHHSGAGKQDGRTFADAAKVNPDRMSYLPMAPIEEYPRLFIPIELGFVPLSSVPFNESKSCIKGMEYAASGIPFCASNTSEYRWLQSHGVGTVCKRARDWQRRIRELLDPEVRQQASDDAVKAMWELNKTLIADQIAVFEGLTK